MMLVIMYGSINQAKLAWNIGDLGRELWFGLISLQLFYYKKPALLRDYEKQRKEGKTQRFIPKILVFLMRT
jgi:AGCS family alanine or glycine:cation symporter